MDRRTFLINAALVGASTALDADRIARAENASSGKTLAPDRSELNSLGTEGRLLAGRTGLWDVTETLWKSPGAQPEITHGLIAERMLMGALLQEIIRPADDKAHRDVKRTDMLTFNRVEGRWQYVSFDTRDPVGLMPAWSTNAGDGQSVALDFYPIAAWSDGGSGGVLMRMRQVIHFNRPDVDSKDQYFTLADGKGIEWLGHRYEYRRRLG